MRNRIRKFEIHVGREYCLAIRNYLACLGSSGGDVSDTALLGCVAQVMESLYVYFYV